MRIIVLRHLQVGLNPYIIQQEDSILKKQKKDDSDVTAESTLHLRGGLNLYVIPKYNFKTDISRIRGPEASCQRWTPWSGWSGSDKLMVDYRLETKWEAKKTRQSELPSAPFRSLHAELCTAASLDGFYLYLQTANRSPTHKNSYRCNKSHRLDSIDGSPKPVAEIRGVEMHSAAIIPFWILLRADAWFSNCIWSSFSAAIAGDPPLVLLLNPNALT